MMVVMKPPLFVRPLTDSEVASLRAGLRSGEVFVLRRCHILLASARGETVQRISAAFGYSAQSVRNVLHVFHAEGLLTTLSRQSNRPKSGRSSRPVLEDTEREQLRQILARGPQEFGKSAGLWTLALVAEVAHEQGLTPTRLSLETIRVALKRMGLNWKRAKAWIASPDPAYTRKKSGATV